MAEAHEAVAFSFKVTEEGVDINVNTEAVCALTRAWKRSFKRRIARYKNSLKNQVYPIRFSSWPILTLAVCLAIHIGYDFSQYGMAALEDFSFKTLNIRTYTRLVAIVLFSFIMWLTGVLLVRYTLWGLFSYMGWMYEPRGTMNMKTKLWMGLIKLLSSKESRLYGYQSSLPKLPVPRIDNTINRYLLSVRPLLTDEQYREMVQLAFDFRKNIATKLQVFLCIKSFLTSNYISDWWEEYVYLHTRNPIMVNSNYYCIDFFNNAFPNSQTGKAANLIYLALCHRKNIDKEKLKPVFINNVIPLCSSQFERQFNTTRIPGETKDSLVHYRDSGHILVISRGRYYRVLVKPTSGGSIMRPIDIEQSLIHILNDSSEASEGEKKLAALTAGERVTWAKARKKYFNHGKNKASLDIIDKAAFVVVLDDVEYHVEEGEKLNKFALGGLIGDCTNRWFDKSFTLFVGTNGMAGLNVEHSWADSPVTALMWEYISAKNYLNRMNSDGIVGYKPDNHCVGTPDESLSLPYRLQWKISDECLSVINQSYTVARTLADDVDLHLTVHHRFGKGKMKKLNVSPDAFIQISLQLAHYRLMERFSLTYEASMTRMFRDGRTETVRSCSVESCDFVLTFCDEKATIKDKTSKFLKAVERHQKLYRDAMTGKGVDRHLFALYVMSRYLGLESPFLQRVLGEPWRLSTSQSPHNQLDIMSINKYPECVCPGGGFGPVADDGYGVSYIIAGENTIFFHVSSKRSCPETDSKKFSDAIVLAMGDIKDLLEQRSSKPSGDGKINNNDNNNCNSNSSNIVNNNNNHQESLNQNCR